MAEQELEGELGVGGVVLGAASGEGCAVASESFGLDGEQDEEVVLEERGDDRSLAELDANGDGSAAKSGAELVGPVAEGRWGVRDDGALALGGAGSAKATSCFLSAQSMPTKAANGTGFCMGSPPVQ
jgi:hypothetical protein